MRCFPRLGFRDSVKSSSISCCDACCFLFLSCSKPATEQSSLEPGVYALPAAAPPTLNRKQEATVYANHWDGVYANRPDQLRREWHCDLRAVNDRMGPFLRRALQQESSIPGIRSTQEQPNIVEAPSSNAAPAKQPLLVDVGCGSSDMAPGIRDAMAADSDGVRMRLLLLDISSVVIGEEAWPPGWKGY